MDCRSNNLVINYIKVTIVTRLTKMVRNSHEFVYVVRCDGGSLGDCFYIGTWGGDDPKTRFLQHKSGIGSYFCKKYPAKSYTVVGHYLTHIAYKIENDVTVDYMRKYGFRRVRGGNMLNMKPNCYSLSALRWWLDGRLRNDLETGRLGLPDLLE